MNVKFSCPKLQKQNKNNMPMQNITTSAFVIFSFNTIYTDVTY